MTLKEELEILRGEPIKFFASNPMDIPCIETSDSEKLCKHPVVSVQMITYNHEPYIRQAIEGVMMQKTDFEFELIIGEDCSQDKTREICFEYQKKYPDKIRVLWWHENVSKFGGNSRRCSARRRGEFIAFCEGDDYWIDPFKLQKQVDVMRANPSVSLCFTGGERRSNNGSPVSWDVEKKVPSGKIPGKAFLLWHMYGRCPGVGARPFGFIMTASTLVRWKTLELVTAKYDLLNWCLTVGDTNRWTALASVSDVYYLQDHTTVYRPVATGACASSKGKVALDVLLVRYYYHRVLYPQLRFEDLPERHLDGFVMVIFDYLRRNYSPKQQRLYMRSLLRAFQDKVVFCQWRTLPVTCLCCLGAANGMIGKVALRVMSRFLMLTRSRGVSSALRLVYEQSGTPLCKEA